MRAAAGAGARGGTHGGEDAAGDTAGGRARCAQTGHIVTRPVHGTRLY